MTADFGFQRCKREKERKIFCRGSEWFGPGLWSDGGNFKRDYLEDFFNFAARQILRWVFDFINDRAIVSVFSPVSIAVELATLATRAFKYSSGDLRYGFVSIRVFFDIFQLYTKKGNKSPPIYKRIYEGIKAAE